MLYQYIYYIFPPHISIFRLVSQYNIPNRNPSAIIIFALSHNRLDMQRNGFVTDTGRPA